MNIKFKSQLISQSFKNAIMEVGALKHFFYSSISSIKNEEDDFKLKYKNGIVLADALDSVFMEKGIEAQKKRVDEIYNISLDNQIQIKDVVEIIISENDYIDGILNKISINFLNRNTYKYCNPNEARQKKEIFLSQKRLLSQSVLSSIVVIFEAYLSEIYELLIISNHESYLNDKQVNVNQIFNKSINEIINTIVKHEVEQKMYDSLATLDLIKDKSGLDIDRHCQIRKLFEEIYYRRNIYVHNKGIVNDIYLSKVNKEYCKEIKIGEYANCSEEYLNKAIRILKIVIATIYYELLRTSICEDEELYHELSNVGFEALCEGEYDIAEHIYNMLRKHKEFEFKDKAIYQVNYINALKQQGKSYEKELKEFDVSIATDNFKIAKMCLEDKFEDAYNLLIISYPISFNAVSIREWPLFIDFRKTEYYEKFKEEHISDFNEFIFEDSQLSEKKASNDECEIDDKENEEQLSCK